MVFNWDSQQINWFVQASNYTGFHRELVNCIRPYLLPEDNVCDIGCGVGMLDLMLCKYVAKITAVDKSISAIDYLKSEIDRQKIKNIKTVCMDACEIDDEYDVILMSFFGHIQRDVMTFTKNCKRKMIRVVNAEKNGNLYPNKYRSGHRNTISTVRDDLERKNICYELVLASLEFGQTLKSREDGIDYIKSHIKDANNLEIESFYDSRVCSTGKDDFPLYLPNLKEIGIFIIDPK